MVDRGGRDIAAKAFTLMDPKNDALRPGNDAAQEKVKPLPANVKVRKWKRGDQTAIDNVMAIAAQIHCQVTARKLGANSHHTAWKASTRRSINGVESRDEAVTMALLLRNTIMLLTIDFVSISRAMRADSFFAGSLEEQRKAV